MYLSKVTNSVTEYDYKQSFSQYHTSAQIAEFLLALYVIEYTIWNINTKNYSFSLKDSIFPYSNDVSENQFN